MFRFSFIKLPQHKTFTHTPIYYDPEKEELKQRVDQAKEDEKGVGRSLSQGSLKESWGRSNRSAKTTRTSNLRVFMLIFILAFAAWILLYY